MKIKFPHKGLQKINIASKEKPVVRGKLFQLLFYDEVFCMHESVCGWLGGNFTVTEISTGLAIAYGNTPIKAKNNAKKKLDSVSISKFKLLLKKSKKLLTSNGFKYPLNTL
jgi:hypothetical protein